MHYIASGVISVSTDYQNGLIEFIHHTRHGVEHRVKLGAILMTAGSEGNIAGHDQPKRIALTTNLYPSALQLFAQLCLLAVHAITHAPAYCTTRHRTGQGTPCAVGPTGTGRTDHAPGDR